MQVPNPTTSAREFPSPRGTGFFISNDGYFVTARHVLIYKLNHREVFLDPSKIILAKPEIFSLPQIKGLNLVKEWVAYDGALLKADFEQVRHRVAVSSTLCVLLVFSLCVFFRARASLRVGARELELVRVRSTLGFENLVRRNSPPSQRRRRNK